MKKLILLVLALVMCMSFVACEEDSKSDSSEGNKNDTVVVADPTEAPTPEPKATPVKLGEKISLDYVDMSLDIFEVTDGYKFEHKKGNVTRKTSIDCKSGMKLICLRGKFTNKAKSEIYPSNNPTHGVMTVNGYEYRTSFECFIPGEAERVMSATPLQEVDYYLYAEVPESLVGSIETCQLKIGFVENMDGSVFVSDDSEYHALYMFEGIPTV